MTALTDFGIKPPKFAKILWVVSEETGVPVKDIASERVVSPVSRARRIFYWVARETTLHSYPSIGNYINRDTSSVMHGVKIVSEARHTNDDLRDLTDKIVDRVTV